MSKSYVRADQDPEQVQVVQDRRRSSATRPYGSLRGRNRQNTRRDAIEQSRREHQ